MSSNRPGHALIRGPFSLWRRYLDVLPRLGLAGSRSAQLHQEGRGLALHAPLEPLNPAYRLRLQIAVWLGSIGTILIALGGIGAGAMPVVGNPFWSVPGINVLARMLHSTTVTVFVGIGFLVVAWLLLAAFVLGPGGRQIPRLPIRTYWRIFALWVLPLAITAPMFTQDIYSYLAQGAIAAQGLDPYSAGPVDILGVQDPLARSVPLMWAHSPAPYGPVALGYGAVISMLTGNNIVLGVFGHRLMSITGLVLTGWALTRLAQRCGIAPQTAWWLGVLNPLTLLHLVAGIHNEALMLGFLLVGMEFVLRGTDHYERPLSSRLLLMLAGTVIVTCAGLIKVTALMALGFTAVAIARWWGEGLRHLIGAGVASAVVAAATASLFSVITGVGFGWITSQGGAAEIISWMSLSTLAGLASSFLGTLLGLGDQQSAALLVFRFLGVMIGAFWVVRMLWASYRGRIHPVGGLGVATLFLVIFFPVVHPWYLLWAILPLAAWANRPVFHFATIVYSVAFSFFILPRGLGLPPATVAFIYAMSALIFIALLTACWRYLKKHPGYANALALPRPTDSAALADTPNSR